VPQELKENPGKLKADAKVRISKQSGRSVTDINKLLSRYEVLLMCC
jgi:signal recognition particle GTPase